MGVLFEKNVNRIPAVVLSAHTMGLGIIRSLGVMNIPVYSVYYEKKDMGFVSKYVKEKFYSAHPENEEPKFIEELISLSKRIGKSVLFPADDATLTAVSKNKKLLENYFIVGCADYDVINKIVDKQYSYSIAERIDVPHPKTLIGDSINEMEISKIQFPVIVKPAKSHLYFQAFDRKMTIVNNSFELFEEVYKAHNLNLEVVIQELIPGEDTQGYNYNCIIENGKISSDFTAQKIRYSPNGFGVPCSVKSCERIDELKIYSQKLLSELKFNGYACLEYKYDKRDCKYKFMEVNGRFNRSILLSTKCGINFPWLMYHNLTDRNIEQIDDYEKNIYWIDSTRDLLMVIKKTIHKENFSKLVEPYIHKNIFAVEDIEDIKPAIKRTYDLLKMGLKFINKKLHKKEKRAYYEEGRYST